mmetsp:Transcript_55462/g.127464  ORF Transcript_55462/g.127464 Transcript_55462/m.127464 type:complete len:228 (-) Transcript_55462:292-975(-)
MACGWPGKHRMPAKVTGGGREYLQLLQSRCIRGPGRGVRFLGRLAQRLLAVQPHVFMRPCARRFHGRVVAPDAPSKLLAPRIVTADHLRLPHFATAVPFLEVVLEDAAKTADVVAAHEQLVAELRGCLPPPADELDLILSYTYQLDFVGGSSCRHRCSSHRSSGSRSSGSSSRAVQGQKAVCFVIPVNAHVDSPAAIVGVASLEHRADIAGTPLKLHPLANQVSFAR